MHPFDQCAAGIRGITRACIRACRQAQQAPFCSSCRVLRRLTRRVEELSVCGAGLRDGLAAVQADVRGSRQAMFGLDVFRAVSRRQGFLLGRSLQQVLANRLQDRLKACPARVPSGSRSLTRRPRQEKASIFLDVLFIRKWLVSTTRLNAICDVHATGYRSAVGASPVDR